MAMEKTRNLLTAQTRRDFIVKKDIDDCGGFKNGMHSEQCGK
jgi:hypothetical protein